MKVLVTFIETQNVDKMDCWLYEVDKSEVTEKMLEKSNKVLEKDKKLFTNI